MAAAPAAGLSLFLHRVRDLMQAPVVTCEPATCAVAVATLLSRHRVGSVVVVDAAGSSLGIVTDRDLRTKVVAAARDATTTTAAEIMSAPLVTVTPAAPAFAALLEMTRAAIHHLVVVDAGRTVGVLSSSDFLRLESTHPVMLAREIGRAPSLEGLAQMAARTTALVRRLVHEGGSAYDIGDIVAELNDRIVRRVLGLTTAALEARGVSAPPVPYCWLAFGSEGRREQTLRTDQDNGLVYADPPHESRAAAAAYYATFGTQVVAGLVAVGFPPCPGNAMASNPIWCQPVSGWREYFRRWIDHPSPEEVLNASIYFDLRALAGAAELAAPLGALVREQAPASRVFLGLMAREVVARRVPLTLLGNIATRRRGPKRGTVDVKGAGSLQLVGAARLAALELALAEVNTVERVRGASARGLYTGAEAREITDAYQHLLRLRMVHQLERLEVGAPPDNDVDPRRLSRADLLLFRDALKTVQRMQAGIRARFNTDVLA